jgi:multidrug efflux system membrane fusion protein
MNHISTKLLLASLAIAFLAVVAIVVFMGTDRSPTVAAKPALPIPVIATTVEQHDVPIVLTGLGTVTALNVATVHSQITGLLTSVNFEEGQFVEKGQLLAQIDPRTYQAQLDQTEATLSHDQVHLKNAELNLQRYTELSKTNSIAQQQVDDQRAAFEELNAQIKNDQAAIENAKAQLSYTSLVAPFDGITGIRLLDVGNIIHPPTSSAVTTSNAPDPNALVVITQVQPISVIFTLPSENIPAVQSSMAGGSLPAIALSQDDKTQLDTGKLLVVNNQADPSSGTVQLKATFPNPERRLWPGTFVNVRLVTSTAHDALTIPLDALQQGPQGTYVFAVGEDKKVTIRPVSVRQTFNAQALIEHGLSAGETVVVRGQYRLSPGTLVTLADANNPSAVPNPSTASSGMLP